MITAVSIDLERELKNISERQHLNAVHEVVVLIRRAVRAGASRIDITLGRERFSIRHDGAPFSDEERTLLFTVLSRASDDDRQKSLTTLEHRFGIAMLSLCVTKQDVVVESAQSFRASHGRLRMSVEKTPGVHISFTRPARHRRLERREIAFYCAHSRVPIYVDGKQLPVKGPESLLTNRALTRVRLDWPEETLFIALVDDGRYKKVRYLDHGIFFGVRTSSSVRAVSSDAVYDTAATEYDENYRLAIKRAQDTLPRGEQELLLSLARRKDALTVVERQRLLRILLSMEKDVVPEPLTEIPLFDTSSSTRLAIRDLRRKAEARGILFYLSAPERQARGRRASLPVLDDESARALAQFLDAPVRPALASSRRDDTPKPSGVAKISVPENLQAFFDALGSDDETRFSVVAGTKTSAAVDGPVRQIAIGVDDPEFNRLATVWKNTPETIRAIRARLIYLGQELKR